MPKVVEPGERWGIYARTVVTSSTIDKILGRTEETSEKIAVIFVQIVENYDTIGNPVLVQRNWHRIDVRSTTIGATCGRIIEIYDTIARTVATTAVTCDPIGAAEGTAVASRVFDTIEPRQASLYDRRTVVLIMSSDFLILPLMEVSVKSGEGQQNLRTTLPEKQVYLLETQTRGKAKAEAKIGASYFLNEGLPTT